MKLKLLIGLLFLTSLLQAQTSNDIKNDIPKVIPPTPNAAALGKFGEIPVNYSTGIPSIGHPIYSWTKGKLSVNLGLNYHAGGVKVEDIASDVGLGWALTGVGRVSRTVRGVPDDDYINGYMHTPNLPQIPTHCYDASQFYNSSPFQIDNDNFNACIAVTTTNHPQSPLIRDIADNIRDGEQDVFSFNINGKSGKFFINKNKVPTLIDQSNIKISFTSYPISPNLAPPCGRIKDFTIIDDNGIKYVFEEKETQSSETTTIGNLSLSVNPTSSYVSSWLLTKIINPETNETIVVTYTTMSANPIKYESGFSESQTLKLLALGFEQQDAVFSFSTITATTLKVNKINLPDGATIDFDYTTNRQDLLLDKALDKIIVKNNRGNVVKNFKLNFSYYDSPDEVNSPIVYSSGNNYNKRLQLANVEEWNNSTTIASKTSFQYNQTPLPRRDSRHIDYWGYTVPFSRNNITRLPARKLKETDYVGLNLTTTSLGGGDRKPDADYCKAGVLDKIIYPTGGFTQFEYEPNKAFSDIHYYENTLQTPMVNYQIAEWNINKSLIMNNRQNTLVDFYCKIAEPNPRVPGGPPYNCLEEQQDAFTCKFVISSTDGTVTEEIQSSYATFLGGLHKAINLPLNKTYQVKLVYSYVNTCEYQFPFTAEVQGTYYTPVQDKIAGGIRIKKIISQDGMGNTVEKEYEYTKPNGLSSATLYRLPNYNYYKTTNTYSYTNSGGGTSFDVGRFFKRTSTPNQSLEYLNGAPLLYTRVLEKQTNLGITEREFSEIGSAYYGEETYPYQPTDDLSFMSSLMTREIVKDNSGSMKLERTMNYNIVNNSNNVLEGTNLKVGTIASGPTEPIRYFVVKSNYLRYGRSELIGTTTKQYENGNVITTTENKTYDPSLYYLRTTTATNSNNEQLKTEFKYPFDLMNGANVYTSMYNNNNISPVVEQKQTNLTQSAEISKSLINYGSWNNNTLFALTTMQSTVKSGPLKTIYTVEQYDTKGNILQAIDKSGVRIAYIWGYNSMYPVAQISGGTYASAISYVNTTVINNPLTTDAQMRTELNNIRTGLASSTVQVTTFTYEPLIGMTSQTNPVGKTNFYEYDGFNRLTTIKNQDGNIVKKICYKYDGQPEDCGLFSSIALSQSFTRNNCPSGQTGSTVTFTVAAGMFSSAISQADADQQALNYINSNGQAYANNNGSCTPNNVCTNCTGDDKKCINNECELGMRVNTNSYYDSYAGKWWCVYHYEWSDGSWSVDYEEENNSPCL